MNKPDTENPIEVVITNQPTKEQADTKIKELAKHLEKIWNNPKSTN